ncbi:MAG: DUF2147 domain-containing protein [Deltaproteobacteria bacterium]|nr:DUF2147 domain-containing protein [Deltaproteobacteria bacterium]MBW2394162.1 DUF2147 domain-containing protein [Deltaproteobacteria bacterium]
MIPALRRFLLALTAAGLATPGFAANPEGLWWAEGGSARVEIGRCGEGLCGQVVWLRSPMDEFGCAVRDDQNPDPGLRTRGMVGIQLLRGLHPSPTDPDEWAGGSIYDPTSGRTYSAVIRLDGQDRLHVRGFLGFRLLGRSTIWNRVQPASAAAAQCREPA